MVVLILPLLLYTAYKIYIEQSSYFPLEEVSIQVGKDAVQNIPLWRNEEDGIFYALLPSETEQLQLEIPFGRIIVLNGTEYVSGDSITDIEYGKEYEISLNTEYNRRVSEGSVIFLQADSVPTVYITAENAYDTDQLVEKKEDEIRTIVNVYNIDGSLDLSSECTMKGRGNTSWKEEKKPYSLKFDDAVSLLGMSAQKKWALIGNNADPSMLRNRIAYTLAAESGCPHTPQLEYVNVYVNGSYQGIYLLMQRVAADGGCLAWEDDEQNYLFEIDARYKEEDAWFKAGEYGIVYSSNQFVFEDEIEKIEKEFNDMLTVFAEEDSNDFLAKCEQYIDLDSWMKQYMIGEFLVNVDLDYASQYFFSGGQGTKLYAGPIWDYDNTMGIFSTMNCAEMSPYLMWAEGRSGSWFRCLMEHESFMNEYVEYYQQSFSNLIVDMIDNQIPMYIEQIDSSMYMNSVRWPMAEDTLEEDSQTVMQWLIDRKAFYDDYWNNPDSYVKVTFSETYGWKDYVYCMKRGKELDQYPQSYLYGSTKWADEDGNIVPQGIVVEEDLRLWPVYE